MTRNLISVTDVCAAKFCKRALYIKLVLGLREPAKPVMVLGSIRHKIYDDANNTEEFLVRQISKDLGRQQVLQMFSNAYEAILSKVMLSFSNQLSGMGESPEKISEDFKPKIVNQAHQRADEILLYSSKSNLFGDQLWEGLTPKILSELRVESENLRLKGIIDRIEVHGTEYVPVELKTGKVPTQGVWPDHRLQVASYILLLKEKFNANIREGQVNYIAGTTTRQIVFNPFMEFEVKSAVDDVFSLIEQKQLPNFCGKSYCSVCKMGENFRSNLVGYSRRPAN